MHILHLCGTASGAPWLLELLRELRTYGHELSVVIAGEDGDLAPALQALGIPYHVLAHDLLAQGDPWRAFQRVRRLSALLRKVRPDVVHSHLYSSTLAGRIAAWLADVPIRLSMNAGPYFLESPILGDLDIQTAWSDTRVIASCEYVRTLYVSRGVPRRKVELVYYGSNASKFNPARADPARVRAELGILPGTPVVGMIAYFYPPPPAGPTTAPHLANRGLKGHDVLLRAVPRVLESVPDARFVLVGDGWDERGRIYRQDMQHLAAALGVDHAVTFAGHRTDIPDTLAAFDVALQCSLSENLGGSVEALMMRRPLVVSRTGGLVETVVDGVTGLVVAPDDPDALATAIVRLLADRALAARLAEQGRAFMLDRFTAQRTAADLDALYRQCTSETRWPEGSPRESGYRPTRIVARWLWSPFWALRLAGAAQRGQRQTGSASWAWVATAATVPAAILRRTADIMIAATVLVAISPVFACLGLTRARRGPLLTARVVAGRHGQPFRLWTLTNGPDRSGWRRLPWFLTLLQDRRLTLFGPPPLPWDPERPMARSDPRVRSRPGIIGARPVPSGPAAEPTSTPADSVASRGPELRSR